MQERRLNWHNRKCFNKEMNLITMVVETNVGIGADVVIMIGLCWLFVIVFGESIDWLDDTLYGIVGTIDAFLTEMTNKY